MDKEREYWETNIRKESNKTSLFFRQFETNEQQTKTGNRYKRVTYYLSEESSGKVIHFCNKSLPNLFAFVYSAVSMLMYRYSYETYITIETPILDQEDVTCTYNKKLPLILDVSPDISFKEWLLMARKVIKETYEHGNYPIQLIYDLFTDSNYECPLTDILLALEGFHNTENLEDLKNEIIIQVSVKNDQLCLNIRYLTECYSENHILRFCEHLKNVFANTLEEMQTKISNVPFIGDEEMQKLIYDFNNTETVYSGPTVIHRCFEAIAEKKPNQIALVFEKQRLTYRELNEKSNELAWILRSRGVGADSIVGLVVDRSVEMIIAILAVLKAGGAYLPIDPDYPQDRIKYMLEHSKTKLVLTNHYIEVSALSSYEILDVRNLSEKNAKTMNVPYEVQGNQLAYVIYTSGSTGRPKGVMVEHSQVVNFAEGMKNKLKLEKYSSFLCLTTISFDIFVLEAVVPLLYGMKVVLTVKGEDINGVKLSETIVRNNVDIMQTTPSRMLLLLNDDAFISALHNVKAVLCGGEPLQELVVVKLAEYKSLRLFNMYGPTETTIWSLVKEITDADSIVIGKPISNTKVYILDEDGQPVPLAGYGQMCISGKCVARGYLYNTEQTNQKFIDNPFIKGERLYKTGDIARWRSNGDIEFCGRIDHQVKIRGYRVELGEIESCLLKFDGINDAKVMDTDLEGTKYLTAFYVSAVEYTSSELHDFLKKDLPDYMIPSHFVKLDALPLTVNGKTDVLKLKEYKIEHHHNIVEPENVNEEFLLRELKEVLNNEAIGVTDNIFHFGANSLNLMRFIQRVRVKFKMEYADVVEHPTIREIGKVAVPRTKDFLHSLNSYIGQGMKLKGETAQRDLEQMEVERSEYMNRYKNLYSNLNFSEITKHSEILLTGSTGYLGIYLLKDLLQNTGSRISVIIRGTNMEEAVNKLRNQFTFYFDESLERYSDKIRVFKGDLTEENLGLSDREYKELAEKVTCIINSAADVSHYGIYENFYKSNVSSVENLLELCRCETKKYLCHISTTSVGNGYIENKKFQIYTEDHGDLAQKPENHYVATKLEAEKRVIEARDNGVPTTIFRVGNLVFNSETGKFQKNIASNAFFQRIKSLLSLQIIPEFPGATLELSYINQVSEAIVLLFNRTSLQNEVFHINNPMTINYQQFATYLHALGRETSTIGFREFIDYLSKNYDNPDCKEAIDILLIHSNAIDRKQQTQVVVSSEKTAYILNKLGFNWEKPTEKHISLMLKYGEGCGFFDKISISDQSIKRKEKKLDK